MDNAGERLIPINIEEEMKTAYIDYSMSVIVARALPDVRDGLKPVHRRVLYGMNELGLYSNRAHKKSARVVGEVLGKYHPHGDLSVYETMVRMAQPWSMRYLMVDGQGNFGSVDGDPAAAMRYTEVRLQKISEEMLSDLDKETVDFQPNFDDSLEEPSVLPTRIPNLLVNGASGIAVGMATNMAPHNLSEVIDGTIAYIENNGITIDELIKFVKAPDFPTGGTIYGYSGVKEAFETGRGRIIIRAKTRFDDKNGRNYIIVSEIPYQVNKSDMISRTVELIKEGKIEGISEIRDESDRKGMRVVYVLKNDAVPNVVLNMLYKYTALQSSFSVNNIALVNGRPQQLNLKELIHYFVEHRHDVVYRRTQFELRKAEERAHILEGYMKVIGTKDDLDRAIRIIRESATPDEAKTGLMEAFELDEIQARAILELRLRTLTGLEIDKIRAEYEELLRTIEDLKDILDKKERRMEIIKEELLEIKEKYGDARRSDIDYAGGDMNIEDLIPDDKMVLTISHLGYIKRTPLSEYKRQSRGGVGNRGATTRDADFLEYMLVATNHQYMLFFTEKGRCFWLRVFEIPEGSKTSKGRAIQNLISIEPGDKVRAYIKTGDLRDEEYVNNHYVVMVTKEGIIKKTSLEAYSRPRVNGINAITVRDGDQLLEAKLTNGKSEIMIASMEGKAIRFEEEKVRPMGRTASGVRGINLGSKKNEVIGMIIIKNEEPNGENADEDKETVLVVSEKGYGKRSDVEDYRITNRGGKGVTTLNVTEKTGKLIAIKAVKENDDLMIINKSGVTIRTSVEEMRVMGRNTQGVRLINLKNNDKIAAVTKVEIDRGMDDEPEDELQEEELQDENIIENNAENNSEPEDNSENNTNLDSETEE